MLLTQSKVGVSSEAVGQDDEFAHDSGEGELGRFAFGDQSLVEVAQDGVPRLAATAAM